MGRAPCCDKANVKRGPWSPEEDAKLKEYMEKNGVCGNWISLPQKAGLRRCGKSCRLRWLNYLRPNIRHGEFSDDEDRVICSLFASIGSRWSIIAAQLPGRTDNDIKNYWNTKLRKKLIGSMATSTQHHHKIPHPFSSPNSFLQQNSSYSSMPSPYSSAYHDHQYTNTNYTITTPVLSFSNPLLDGDFTNQVNDSHNSNLLVFARDQTSCSTSSDNGSCITTTATTTTNNNNNNNSVIVVGHDYGMNRTATNCENQGMHGYFSTNDEYQNFLINDEKLGVANDGFSDNLLDFGIEEIKQLIGTNNNLNYFLDEIKTEDKYLYG